MLVLASALVLALAPVASGKIVRSGSALPPGQSGYVSLTGLARGTGSPHLTDQTPLASVPLKPALFNQPLATRSARGRA